MEQTITRIQEKSDADSEMKTQTSSTDKHMKTQKRKIKNLKEEKRKLKQSMKKHENKMINQRGTTIQEQIINNIKSRNIRRHYKMIEKSIWREVKNYKMIKNATKKRETEISNQKATDNQELIRNQIKEDRRIQTNDLQQELSVNNN